MGTGCKRGEIEIEVEIEIEIEIEGNSRFAAGVVWLGLVRTGGGF